LLEAAIDLFVERGYAATRLEDVARRAGVSKGTLYLYYENKEELFKAVVRSNIVPVIGEAEVRSPNSRATAPNCCAG
jgi:AcrR family transcriptional regulator